MVVIEAYTEKVVAYRTSMECNRCGIKVRGQNYAPDGWEVLWSNTHLCPACQEACRTCDYNYLKPRCGVICNPKTKQENV